MLHPSSTAKKTVIIQLRTTNLVLALEKRLLEERHELITTDTHNSAPFSTHFHFLTTICEERPFHIKIVSFQVRCRSCELLDRV